MLWACVRANAGGQANGRHTPARVILIRPVAGEFQSMVGQAAVGTSRGGAGRTGGARAGLDVEALPAVDPRLPQPAAEPPTSTAHATLGLSDTAFASGGMARAVRPAQSGYDASGAPDASKSGADMHIGTTFW
jgi:hypothetical protein